MFEGNLVLRATSTEFRAWTSQSPKLQTPQNLPVSHKRKALNSAGARRSKNPLHQSSRFDGVFRHILCIGLLAILAEPEHRQAEIQSHFENELGPLIGHRVRH